MASQTVSGPVDSPECGIECRPAARALAKCGANCGRGTPISGPPKPKPTSIAVYFLRQFYSPLIYILLLAAAISLLLGDWQESIFIMIVLLLNSLIGTIQECLTLSVQDSFPCKNQIEILCSDAHGVCGIFQIEEHVLI